MKRLCFYAQRFKCYSLFYFKYERDNTIDKLNKEINIKTELKNQRELDNLKNKKLAQRIKIEIFLNNQNFKEVAFKNNDLYFYIPSSVCNDCMKHIYKLFQEACHKKTFLLFYCHQGSHTAKTKHFFSEYEFDVNIKDFKTNFSLEYGFLKVIFLI